MTWVLRCKGFADNKPCKFFDMYLKSFDADAYKGRGCANFTDKVAEAMHFNNAADAMSAWRTQSVVKPRRPDGKPNRPLTAMHMMIERGEVVHGGKDEREN